MSMKEIHLSSDVTFESFQDQNWNIGDSYEVEFFPGKLVPVFLYDTNSDLEEPIKTMSKDQILYVNFEYASPKIKAPPICLFIFCCSSGVFLFKQTDFTPNMQLKKFMSKESKKRFFGFRHNDMFRLKKLFGNNFYINFKNAVSGLFPPDETHNIAEIFLQYAGKPSTDFTYQIPKEFTPILTMKHVLESAFCVYALSLSHPNFPPKTPTSTTSKNDNPQQSAEDPQETNLITPIVFDDAGHLPENINKKSPIGSKYNIQFYPGDFVEVTLLNANSDIQQYIDIMSKDSVIFADFESTLWSQNQPNSIPINVFSFYCNAGIFIFQSTQRKGNDQLGEFLRAKEGQKFYTFGISQLYQKLRIMFGKDMKFDIEDLYMTRIKRGQHPKLYNFVEKFGGKPLVDREVMKKAKAAFWSNKVLSINHIIRAAYVPISLARSFPNLPQLNGQIGKIYFDFDGKVMIETENNEDDQTEGQIPDNGQIEDYGKISFSREKPLSTFRKSNWTVGSTAEIEFFPGTFSKVYLLDAVEDFERFIPQIALEGEVIFIDFEYVPLERSDAAPVCLFQFCNSSGTYLFRQRTNETNEVLKKFLSKENGLEFVAKGIWGDMTRLRLFFGNDFKMNIEDVEVTRLMPYHESRNFEKMVLKFAGKPTAQFKDKRISCSDWNAKFLKKIQVIYSAFDVVALYRCYQNFQGVKISQYFQPNLEKYDVKRKLASYAVSLKKFNKKDLKNSEKVNKFWDLNANLVLHLIGVNFDLLKFVVFECLSTIGNCLLCKQCQSYNSQFFRKFLDHCKKDHFIEKSEKNDDDLDVKVLFMNYLNFTGRISLLNLNCIMCSEKSFNSESELCQHCWNYHSIYVIEFLPIPKKKKGVKIIEEEEYSDNDNENENDNDNDNENENDSDDDEYDINDAGDEEEDDE